jgi:hypothetical protein
LDILVYHPNASRLAFLLLVKAESLWNTRHARIIALAGASAGIAVAVAGVSSGVWGAWLAIEYDGHPFWAFVSVATVPVGVGVSLLLSAAALGWPAMAHRLAPFAAGLADILLMAAVAMAGWLAAGNDWLALPLDHQSGVNRYRSYS